MINKPKALAEMKRCFQIEDISRGEEMQAEEISRAEEDINIIPLVKVVIRAKII